LRKTLEELNHLFEFYGFKSAPFRFHYYQGVRESMMRWRIFLSMVVRNAIKRKGKRQGETEGKKI
jgi:hypothetical protein